MNVAVTDPLQQLGLVAFDDQELEAGAAAAARAVQQTDSYTKPTWSSSWDSKHETASGASGRSSEPRQPDGGLLYLAAFSRDCS
eukprot:gene10553-10713_t